MIPIWGSGKEALADFEVENYVGAAVNTGLAVSDVFLAKAVVSGLAKGGLKVAGPHVWRVPYPEVKAAQRRKEKLQGARQWMGEKGFVKPGDHGHHWAIPQKAKFIPDWVKNQPPFINPMDAVKHGRTHGPYTVDGVKLPRFNAVERLWHATPPWAKAGYISSAGHGGTAAGRAAADGRNERRVR